MCVPWNGTSPIISALKGKCFQPKYLIINKFKSPIISQIEQTILEIFYCEVMHLVNILININVKKIMGQGPNDD